MYHILDVLTPLQAISQYNHEVHPTPITMEYISVKIYPIALSTEVNFYLISIICRWADKFCLHCNIFIYIRHVWVKRVLCSRMVSLFHHTSLWTRRCLQSSPSAHRNGRVFRCLVQTACCYWTLNHGKSSSNWNSQTNASCLWWSVCWSEYSKTLGKVKCVEVSIVRHWVRWSLQ